MTLETGGSSECFTRVLSTYNAVAYGPFQGVAKGGASESFTRKLALPDRGPDITQMPWPELNDKCLFSKYL